MQVVVYVVVRFKAAFLLPIVFYIDCSSTLHDRTWNSTRPLASPCRRGPRRMITRLGSRYRPCLSKFSIVSFSIPTLRPPKRLLLLRKASSSLLGRWCGKVFCCRRDMYAQRARVRPVVHENPQSLQLTA